jgi:hypothetical protein
MDNHIQAEIDAIIYKIDAYYRAIAPDCGLLEMDPVFFCMKQKEAWERTKEHLRKEFYFLQELVYKKELR